MDWCVVNWRSATGNETFDVIEHECNFYKKLRQKRSAQCHYNRPRWNIAWTKWVPIVFGILNALLK